MNFLGEGQSRPRPDGTCTDLNASIHWLKSSVLRHLMWKVAVLESRVMSFRPGVLEMAAWWRSMWSRTGCPGSKEYARMPDW